jgi:streptomycin 6-kinase
VAPGEDKAAQLAGIVRRFRQDDDEERWGAALDSAHEVARHLSATREPTRDVLCHGDPHPGNALQTDGIPRYKLVDPDGFRCEPEYDVGVTLRDFSREILASRDHAAARTRHEALCLHAAELTGTDAQRVRQWAFVERVTTGLYLRWFNDDETAESFLDAATVLLPG